MVRHSDQAGRAIIHGNGIGSTVAVDLANHERVKATEPSSQSFVDDGGRDIEPKMLTTVDMDEQEIAEIAGRIDGGAENIEDVYPLTPLQEGMLFHRLVNEDGDTYVLSVAFEAISRTQAVALVDALNLVIARHTILRSAVLWERLSRPVQVVTRNAPLPVHNLTFHSDGDPIEQVRRIMRPQGRNIDVTKSPLLRLDIGHVEKRETHYALLQIHHMVCDHRSLNNLLAELAAYLQGRGAELQGSMPFRCHVEDVLQSFERTQADAYFRTRLGSVEGPTAPFGIEAVGDSNEVRHESSCTLGCELSEEIRFEANQAGVSPARLFHAALGLVVAHTSGCNEAIFGTVLSARSRGTRQSRSDLGMCVNTLPLRLNLDGVSCEQLIQKVDEELRGLLAFAGTPLALAQRCSRIACDRPLFSTLLNYRRIGKGGTADILGALSSDVRVLFRGEAWTHYPVTVIVDDLACGFVLTAQTDQRISAEQIVGYIETAIQSLTLALRTRPETPALSLSVLTEAERHEVLECFNGTQLNGPPGKLVHEVFEERAGRSLDAVAVVGEGRSLTYGELNSRANQLAHCLRRKGLGPDRLVGICVERNVDLVIGLLGILKAGAAYVPLDPSYPVDRLSYMLKNAAPNVVLIHAGLRERLPLTSAEVVRLDEDWQTIARESESNLDSQQRGVGPHNLAYVIYTSGSTGKPKGVMVDHWNVARLFSSTDRWFNFNDQDVWTLFHSYAFDFSVWELWGALLYGGRVVVVPYLVSRSPQAFFELVCREMVTVLNQTPSAFTQLIEAQDGSGMHHTLRTVIFGGESLELRQLRPWAKRNGVEKPKLINMYGITETTVHVTYRVLTEKEIEAERGSPVGGPIPDLRTYLLTSHRQPVPVGVVGEIHVAGAGVARGYLNRPDLTSERFLPDPFNRDGKMRMYKTGDLGRWRVDGSIEYLGRNDHQVKIRGFRIELAEIEAHLSRHPQLKEAVVIAREHGSGEKRLVAYVVPLDAMNSPQVERLRSDLRTVLPDYMIPAAFVMLERMPLSPNGKLDRRALPAPELEAYATREYDAPSGPVENELAEIWRDVLDVERVGRQDNFFELGGHSLMLIRLSSRASAAFGVQLHVSSVLMAACLWEMAALISSLRTERTTERVHALEGTGNRVHSRRQPGLSFECEIPKRKPDRPVPLIAMQRFWLKWRGKVARRVIRGPTSATRIVGLLDVDLLKQCVRLVTDRHEMLRTRFQEKGDVCWHQIDTTCQCGVEVIDLSQSMAKEASVHSMVESFLEEQVDVSIGPLFTLKLARLSNCEHVMMVGLDHMISDGASSDILLREILTAYNKLGRGASPDLPELPIQFGDYAVWQQDTRTIWYDTHAEYWINRFKGAPPLRIPVTDGLQRVSGPFSVEHYFEFNETLSMQLRLISREEKVFLAIVMLTVYVIVIHRWCNEEDLVVVFQSDGRYRPELENVIGFVTTLLPLRVRVQKDDTFRNLLKRVNAEYYAAYSHIGPERLSDCAERKSDGVLAYETDVGFSWTPLRGERLMIDAPAETERLIRFEPYPYKHKTGEPVKFAFCCFDGAAGLYCRMTYRRDLFARSTIEKFGLNFQRISAECARYPDAQIALI